MGEDPEYPNTKRFWRLNEIEGLKMRLQFRDRSTAQDPKELEAIINNQARLDGLLKHERRLLERYKRLSGRNPQAQL